ncbi:MAG TPA: hypothetical protein DCS93_08080 [Microscillaceae bacterium]|nr:hypothetical protein [Microscillaceae bacterium]
MPRSTDTHQLEKVKKVAIQLIVEKGYEKTTVADIAKVAGVATGYIYRHYKGKQAMIQQIFEERSLNFERIVDDILVQHTDMQQVIEKYVSEVFKNARENNVVYRFMFLIAQEKIFGKSGNRQQIIERVCNKIFDKGKSQFASTINAEIIQLVLLNLPQQFVEYRINDAGEFNNISAEDEYRILQICKRALLTER